MVMVIIRYEVSNFNGFFFQMYSLINILCITVFSFGLRTGFRTHQWWSTNPTRA